MLLPQVKMNNNSNPLRHSSTCSVRLTNVIHDIKVMHNISIGWWQEDLDFVVA